LIRDDFPTLDLPIIANSGIFIVGQPVRSTAEEK